MRKETKIILYSDHLLGWFNLLIWIIYFNLCRDDQILFNGLLYYLASYTLSGASRIPLWRTDGVVMAILLHAGPVEFLYYWLHRALHHHFLYSRYHSHHHSSIVTEPITCESPRPKNNSFNQDRSNNKWCPK